MSVAFYPNQRLSVAGTELNIVQSANVDFSVKRQEVFEFGSSFAVDFVQTDAATVNMNFEYALATGASYDIDHNLNAIGLDDLSAVISDTVGKTYVLTGAGTLTVPSGVVQSYSFNAAVGSVPTVSIGIMAQNATYSAAASAAPKGAATSASAFTPQTILLKHGGTEYVTKSAKLNLDIPRQMIYKLGSLTPIAIITNGAAKVTIDAELILGSSSTIDEIPGDITIELGTAGSFTAKKLKRNKFSTKYGTNDVVMASVTWEGIITDAGDLTLLG